MPIFLIFLGLAVDAQVQAYVSKKKNENPYPGIDPLCGKVKFVINQNYVENLAKCFFS